MHTVRSGKMISSTIYHSLESVIASLTAAEMRDIPEVHKLLRICTDKEIIVEIDGKYSANNTTNIHKDESSPFLVIEGLDGSGKTTLASMVRQRYRMNAMQTPPDNIAEFRDFFDNQPESVRRAFYSLGNYLAAENVLKCTYAVIMDRFWHSTAAYAIGNYRKTSTVDDLSKFNLDWPSDLLQPNTVLFLCVSEAERLFRHSTRQLQTNTPEEQTLAEDQILRDGIVDIYRRIKGPPFVEVNVNGSLDEVKSRIFKIIEDKFPSLRNMT